MLSLKERNCVIPKTAEQRQPFCAMLPNHPVPRLICGQERGEVPMTGKTHWGRRVVLEWRPWSIRGRGIILLPGCIPTGPRQAPQMPVLPGQVSHSQGGLVYLCSAVLPRGGKYNNKVDNSSVYTALKLQRLKGITKTGAKNADELDFWTLSCSISLYQVIWRLSS